MFDKNNPIYMFLLNAGIITSATKMSDDARNVQLFEAAVKSVQPEKKMRADTALGESALAYLAWSEEYQRMNHEMNKHRQELKTIQTHCPHSFRGERRPESMGGSGFRCIACRKIG